MYLHIDKINKLLSDFKGNVLLGLKGKHNLLFSLLEEDDWSLVIKGHALIESVITELILLQTNENKLKPIIERLPLHDSQASKIKILKIYSLITVEQSRFIKKLSELRNNLAHKIENINFLFDEHVKTFDKNQSKFWIKSLTWYAEDQETRETYSKAAIENPKFAIWMAIFMFVSSFVIQVERLKTVNSSNDIADETTKEIFEKLGLVGRLKKE